MNEESYLQKFTPRRAKSIWSKINTQHIERLIQEGKMKPAGMQQVEAAKKDGRWVCSCWRNLSFSMFLLSSRIIL